MADDKQPGFFKRLFGFGKTETEVAPAPDAPSIVDDAAERIAREIAEARVAAETAAAAQSRQDALDNVQAQEAAEAETAATALRDKAQRERTEAERIAAQKRAEDARREAAKAEAAHAEQLRLDEERIAAERVIRLAAERAQAEEAEIQRATAEKADAVRIAAEKAEAETVAEPSVLAPSILAPAVLASAVDEPPAKVSWWQKLKSGLSRTASTVSGGITGLFTKRKLDAETLEELEDLLIQADLGIDVAARISSAVGKGRYDKEIEPEEVKAILAEEVAKVLAPVAMPLVLDPAIKPYVLLMVGVNGSGKTTTIGKLAFKFKAEGKSVMLAAGDTFRAAAIEQLKVWGERTGAPVIARDQGSDAAGLAFDAVKAARDQNVDVLLVDTAGRLQNRTELMAELEKVVRVIKKLDETAPHGVLLVLDATVGQNALSQVEIFGKTAGVTGLVMTKLDGTARGGILVAIAEKFKLPIHFIGVGEGVDDLEPFAAQDFARAIAGLERLA